MRCRNEYSFLKLSFVQFLLWNVYLCHLTLSQTVEEYEALANFQESLAVSSWSFPVSNYCTLAGVTCNSNFNVIGIELYDQALSGSIPGEALRKLPFLEVLDLGENPSLLGTIPTEIGDLSKLEFFSIRHSYMSGSLPSEITQLKLMQSISLYDTLIEGTIPSEIGLMTSLSYVSFDRNQMNGAVPSEIGNLMSLSKFYISSSLFSGSVPSELFALRSLSSLWIQDNALTGSLPDATQLSSLEDFNAENNYFSGVLPSSLTNLPSIRTFSLRNNNMKGTLPEGLFYGPSIYSFDVRDNKLSGIVPVELFTKPTLSRLLLSNNRFTGDIPALTGVSLFLVWLEGNSFSGIVNCGTYDVNTIRARADCGGIDPEVICDCCYSCFFDSTLAPSVYPSSWPSYLAPTVNPSATVIPTFTSSFSPSVHSSNVPSPYPGPSFVTENPSQILFFSNKPSRSPNWSSKPTSSEYPSIMPSLFFITSVTDAPISLPSGPMNVSNDGKLIVLPVVLNITILISILLLS